MPMSAQRYQRIKTQVTLWRAGNLEDAAHLDNPVLVDMLLEMRGVIEELLTANDEGNGTWLHRALPYAVAFLCGGAVVAGFLRAFHV